MPYRTLPFLLLCLAGLSPSSALSADPDVRFVEAMRDRGYFDLTLDYLNRVGADRNGSDVLRGRLEYERAVTRLEQAKSLRIADQRELAVDRARRDLEKFVSSSKDTALAAEGYSRLADALADQGRVYVGRAEGLAASQKAERSQYLKRARQAYDDARDLYKKAEDSFDKALEAYKAVKPGSSAARRRIDLRLQLVRSRVMGSRTLYYKAQSYPAGSKLFKQLNEQAAEELGDHAEYQPSWPICLLASLYEGRCYQATGQHKLAMGCFEEIVFKDAGVAANREIFTLAHAYLAASYIAEKLPEKAEEVGEEWLKELRAGEVLSAAAALKYQLAEAARLQAGEKNGSEANRLLVRAQRLLRESSQIASEFQTEARLRLAEVNKELGAANAPAATFTEAYQIGRDAIDTMRVSGLAAKAAKNNNTKAAKGLQEDVSASRQAALVAFRQALRLVDDETEAAKVNEVRYWLSFLYWEQGDYLRAAAISEFLATSYPDDPSAERSAKLAMASFERLYNEVASGGAADAEFETREWSRVAEFATRRWAGEPTADAAFSVLMSIALRSGDLSVAKKLLDEVPEQRRGGLELKLSIAQWERAVRMSMGAGEDPRARQAAQRAKAKALRELRGSFDKVRGGAVVTPSLATAALYVSQALLDQGQTKASVKLLEDKSVGPLVLVNRQVAAASRPGYAAETFKTALRAYVSVSPPRTEQALKMMNRLESVLGDKPDDLTRVYFGLGLQLQRQIEEFNAAGKRGEAKRLVKAFSVFLERLSDRAGQADWVTQQWIGQTYIGLGEGLGEDDGDQSREYFARAASLFEAMIARAAKEPGFAPRPTSVLAARMQLGQSQRKTGDYAAAIDTFSSILLERPMTLDVQKAAAYTYQDWGAEDDPNQLMNAIRGGRIVPETSKNLIWGWSKLAAVVGRAKRSKPEYEDLFFECWLNVATCRYLAAERASGAERTKNLQSARRTIRSMYRQYQGLGGPVRRGQFDQLLKQIQKLEGKDESGLDELQS